MTEFETALAWMEGTRVAQAIAQSAVLTGALSGAHLIGLTLVLGGALATSLRGFGVMFGERPVADVTGAITSAMTLGLGVSVTTGLLLVAPRLSAAVGNDTFRLKMLLLLVAATFHLTRYRRIGVSGASRQRVRWSSAVALTLWLAVALAGCAYILLE